ncbi:MAG: hypothetical protein ACOZNI_07880 [Myxococcota bacterium]
MSWDLVSRKADWTAWIKRRLAEAGNLQSTVAAELEELEGTSKRSQLNRFVKGEAAEVETWFTLRDDWLAVLAGRMGRLKPDDLRRQFEQIRDGTSPVAAWHPAFPDVAFAEAEIPAPLEAREGDNPEAIARSWVEDVRTRTPGKPHPLGLIGPAGASRDVAARQVRDAVLALVPDADVRVVEGAPKEEDAVWRIVVATGSPERVYRTARLGPWRAREAHALALRLAASESTSPDAHARLREYAARVVATDDDDALTLPADLHIRLCAEVARRGCPADVAGIRALLTAAAWRRASQGAERLAAFDERLLEKLFAALATRSPGTGETGGWLSAPRGVVAEILGGVARELGGVAAGRPLLALVGEVVEEKRPAARSAALEKLRLAILADPAEALLAELVVGDVLAEESSVSGPRLRAADPVLAAVWAARGIGARPAIGGVWSRLCDPAWSRIVGEQARGGLSFAALADALAGAPAELAVDAALVLLHHAAAAPAPVRDPRLVPSWATVLWFVALGFLQKSPGPEPWGWSARASAVLAVVSRRYRFVLPRMGDDPVATVEVLVPEPARALVARWRCAPTGEGESLRERVVQGFSVFFDRGSRRTLSFDLRHLARAQFVADTPMRARAWRGPVARVVEEAERGDALCGAMLSGEAWASRERGEEQDAAGTFWREVPWSLRVDWAVRAGPRGTPGYRVLSALLDEAKSAGDPRLVDLAVRVGVEPLEEVCRQVLLHPFFGGALSVEFALAVAERLRLVGLLEEVAAWPTEWAQEAVPVLRDGWILVGGFGMRPVGDEKRAPRLPLHVRLAELDAVAERAAVALHRLGKPDALRARWLAPGPALSERAEKVLARIDGLLWLAANPTSWWRHYEVPFDALGALAVESPAEAHGWFRFEALGLAHPRAWPFDVHPDDLQPRLARALNGLRTLLHTLPDDLPEALDAALEGLASLSGRVRIVGQYDRDAERRISAARLLLQLGEDGPIETWARGDHLGEGATFADRAAARAVEETTKEDDSVLARAWAVYERVGGGSRDANRARWDRDALKTAGSAPREGDDRPDHPLPFVVALGLASDDPGEVASLTRENGRRAAWLPVARRRHRFAPDARTQAFWALEIARHQPGAREVGDALRAWLHDDPDPWSGGKDWHREGWRSLGGTWSLLAAAVAAGDAWVADGLARLFRLALALPIGGDTDEIGRTPDRVRLRAWGDETPWPLAPLADALVARGRADVVLDGWRHPPDGEGSLPNWTRAESLRNWLDAWWTAHAPTAELKANLVTDELFRRRAAWELMRRGELDLREDAIRVTRDWPSPAWELLARAAPEELVPVLRARIERGSPREIAIAQLAASAEDLGAVETLAEIRRMVAEAER